jgi:D-lactate dehydrogenase (cytochrome)
MTACNASGARTFHYGATRPHIHALHAVLADGDILDLQRGRESAQGRKFELQTISGRRIKGALPSYTSLSIKNAAGYWVHDNMDLIDLFIGSEGTLGVFSQIELRLVPAPASIWGIMAFLPSEKAALQFVIGLRKGTDNASDRPVAIEFFDFNALNLLRSQRQHKAGFNELPALPEHFHTAIYVEYHGPNEDTVGSAIEHMCGLLENCGGSEDTAWIATEHHDLQRIYDFRHAVPESVNMIIDERRKTDPALTKLGTDMAVSDEHLLDVMHMYHADLADAGLEYVIFGHIGNNHVHVNILPRNQAEYRKGHELYADWARRVVQMGGTVSAEHGIGKLKRDYLVTMYSRQGVEEMRKLKELFDPWYQLNPGNLFL